MKVCIKRCEQSGHEISWEGVASLVKEAHHNGDANLTKKEIDLGYSLKDKQEKILISHTIKFFSNIFMYMFISFPAYHKHALSNHDQFKM